MGYAKVHSAQTLLLDGHIIDIEVDILRGLHSFTIVGLPDKAVEESRDRVSAALHNSGFETPKQKNQKIVIALAPASIKKEGPNYDVGIALAYLLASDQVSFDATDKLFLGELALDGTVRPIQGVIQLARKARSAGYTELYVPKNNARQARLIEGITIYPVENLREIVLHLMGESDEKIEPETETSFVGVEQEYPLTFNDIKGNETAKRGLIIAASGGHNIALYGPPGTGKTMLARAFCSILPPLSFEDMLDVTGIHSLSHLQPDDLVTHPPFRSPHHTSSYVAMVGGGTIPRPGEVTLAHKGVLFLDEFPEFERKVLEALRQPLEDRIVSISRSKARAVFPADFVLLAAMNPCPCGHFGSDKECTCTPIQRERYTKKLSGPIMDRIDMWIEVSKVDHEKLSEQEEPESVDPRNEVLKARSLQEERFASHKHLSKNSDMGARDILNLIVLKDDVKKTLIDASKKLGLSARAYHRLIKLGRTIADLEESTDIELPHIMEALQYRAKKL